MYGGAWKAAAHGVAKESDMTERLHFHFPLSCIGEGNGNPLQCSCLENPREGGAWWAAVYEVAQSRIGLKQRSRSNSSSPSEGCKWHLLVVSICGFQITNEVEPAVIFMDHIHCLFYDIPVQVFCSLFF